MSLAQNEGRSSNQSGSDDDGEDCEQLQAQVISASLPGQDRAHDRQTGQNPENGQYEG